ncbi:MAG: sodium:solute symporter [Candidatus Rokubacteria bacterium]|nr:sodium:solute symporter [Candidatus Rokubacteria bacterium]
MSLFDWGVIAFYLVGIVATGGVLARSQRTISDYYLGGRTVRWWQSGLSTMATQLGAISFVSAPAFVALKGDGGMKWLAYEFGVPLALIFVMAILIPVFHRAGVVSIYEYLEQRFDAGTRTIVSLLFQVGRGLATAVSVLAAGLILSTALGISTWTAILVIGAVTILYDVLGGIRVVILTDVAQMLIIMVGILICGGVALNLVGWGPAWSALDPERLRILDFGRWGLDQEGTYAFWPMTLGGLFLYMSYYGCDQSQVQRELSVGRIDDVRKSLLVNAFGRFPVVLLYTLMGVFVGAVVATPEFLGQAAAVMGSSPDAVAATLERDPDRMVPLFILAYLPPGGIGLLFVAILSAFMSSLDSALNSMSAVTVRDFYQRYWKRDGDAAHYLRASKLFTVFWGVFCIAFALLFTATPEATRQTTIVLINAIGSLLYGPILAAFVLGILTRWARPGSTKAGILAGVGLNIVLWQVTSVSWLWWNVTGFAATILVAAALSPVETGPEGEVRLGPPEPTRIRWPLVYAGIAGYFLAIVGLCRLIEVAV